MQDLVERILAGDLRAAARLMRLADDDPEGSAAALGQLYRSSKPSALVGLTGSPGAGKSTLVDQLVSRYRRRAERVGVVAVDPSSPFSGGAILGDRLRMMRHALDPEVFIRSLASRGHIGGLSPACSAVITVLEAARFDRVLVETVGTGQAEVEIAGVADSVVVVLAPGLGDEVQALKAGLMEIADVYVVNKADREGADRTVRDVEMVQELRPRRGEGWSPPVLKVVATTGDGVDEVLDAVEAHRDHLVRTGELGHRRASRARAELEIRLEARVRRTAVARAGGEAALAAAAERVAARASDAWSECARWV